MYGDAGAVHWKMWINVSENMPYVSLRLHKICSSIFATWLTSVELALLLSLCSEKSINKNRLFFTCILPLRFFSLSLRAFSRSSNFFHFSFISVFLCLDQEIYMNWLSVEGYLGLPSTLQGIPCLLCVYYTYPLHTLNLSYCPRDSYGNPG